MIKESRWIHLLFYPLLMQLTLSIARITVLLYRLTLYVYVRWSVGGTFAFKPLLFYKVAEEGDD